MVHLKKKNISCPSPPTLICTLEEVHVFFSYSFFYWYTIKCNINFPPVILEGMLWEELYSVAVLMHMFPLRPR